MESFQQKMVEDRAVTVTQYKLHPIIRRQLVQTSY